MQSKTKSSIKLPQSITLTIETSTPAADDMTRYLVFENYEGRRIELAIKLMRTGTCALEVTEFPNTTHDLQKLGSLNHRSYWDKIYLSNKGRDAAIDIKKMTLIVHYHKVVSGGIKDIYLLSNTVINETLAGGDSEVFLTPHVEKYLLRSNGMHRGYYHPVAKQAIKDLGKSGTSDVDYDEYGDNPKYRGWISYECSEFVSWYLHENDCWRKFPNETSALFRDITYTEQLHIIFKNVERTYYYHNGKKKFINEITGAEYTPKAGDPLFRKGANGFEHSMIMFKWNPKTLIATVIDGPYPVTLRTVDIDDMETRTDNQKDFIVAELKPQTFVAIPDKGSIRGITKRRK